MVSSIPQGLNHQNLPSTEGTVVINQLESFYIMIILFLNGLKIILRISVGLRSEVRPQLNTTEAQVIVESWWYM